MNSGFTATSKRNAAVRSELGTWRTCRNISLSSTLSEHTQPPHMYTYRRRVFLYQRAARGSAQQQWLILFMPFNTNTVKHTEGAAPRPIVVPPSSAGALIKQHGTSASVSSLTAAGERIETCWFFQRRRNKSHFSLNDFHLMEQTFNWGKILCWNIDQKYYISPPEHREMVITGCIHVRLVTHTGWTGLSMELRGLQ